MSVCILVLMVQSVHGPSESEVPGHISSVVPVGPPVQHVANSGFPQSILDDAQVIRATLSLTVVEGESHAVGHGAELQARVNLFLCDVFLHVPSSDFVGSGVHCGHASLRGSNCGLLIGVLAIAKLEDFANKHALGVSGVGSYQTGRDC